MARTPLTRLVFDDAPAKIYLELENLQPTGAEGTRNALVHIRDARKAASLNDQIRFIRPRIGS